MRYSPLDQVERGVSLNEGGHGLFFSREQKNSATRGESWSSTEDSFAAIKVFFWQGLFIKGQWKFPLLLALSAASYETVASFVMNVIGDFYLAISSQDGVLFIQVLWRSLLITTAVAALKAMRDLAKECAELQWRKKLVDILHAWYLRGKTPYVLATADWAKPSGGVLDGRTGKQVYSVRETKVDNPDQRIAADSSTLATAFSSLVHDTLIVPGLVVYYTWFLVGLFGWTAPAACYLYFAMASFTNWVVLRRVIPAVYGQESAEGSYRYEHAWLRSNAESVAFYGPKAMEEREVERLGKSFEGVVAARWLVIRSHVPLYFWTLFYDYFGSIVNYAAVGCAILYLSKAEGLTEAEISSLVARGSYSCLYLINAFSQAFKAAEAASRIAGSASRVMELLRVAGFTSKDLHAIDPWADTSLPSDSHPTSRFADDEDIQQMHYSPPSQGEVCADENPFHGDEDWLLHLEGFTLVLPGLGVDGIQLDEDDQHLASSKARTIVSNLSLTVVRGKNLLIMGPSGCGKTSFLRGLAGIWRPVEGSVKLRPGLSHPTDAADMGEVAVGLRGERDVVHGYSGSRDSVMFLPQRPYLFMGTLLAQVAYPSECNVDSSQRVAAVLNKLGLSYLMFEDQLEDSNMGFEGHSTRALGDGSGSREGGSDGRGGLNTPRNWPSVLSPGESQRMGLARVLYHRPHLAFLDESTSALSEDAERDVYRALEEAGVTVVTVGHRSSLTQWHAQVLTFGGPGSGGAWELSEGN